MDYNIVKEWAVRRLLKKDKNGRIVPQTRVLNSDKFYQSNKEYVDFLYNYTSFYTGYDLRVRLYLFLYNYTHMPKCPVCGKEVKFDRFSKGFYKTCSKKCNMLSEDRKLKSEKTCLKRYGVKNVSQASEIKYKKRKTKIQNNTCESNPEIIDKILTTKSSKYGFKRRRVDWWKCTDEYLQASVTEKAKITSRHRYGYDYTGQVPEFIGKRYKTMLGKYGVKVITQSKEHQQKIVNKRKANIYNKKVSLYKDSVHTEVISSEDTVLNEGVYTFRCKACGDIFKRDSLLNYNAYDKLHKCSKCFPYNISSAENEIYAFIKQFDVGATHRATSVLANKRLELDIYSARYKLAIEYDGLAWHSFGKTSPINNWDRHDVNVHVNKTILCEAKNIRLFRILDIEWNDAVKKDIWKSMITNYFGRSRRVYGRQCDIIWLGSSEANAFLNKNHLQGATQSSINLGLVYKGELLSVMTFGNPRFNRNYKYELLRFCNKKYYTVVGGASKLLSCFRRHYSGSVISYANRRWSNGGLYYALGFNFVTYTVPNYWYFKQGSKLFSRVVFQKHKLPKLLDNYDPEVSEKENMVANGYRIYYDCGNIVFKLCGV